MRAGAGEGGVERTEDVLIGGGGMGSLLFYYLVYGFAKGRIFSHYVSAGSTQYYEMPYAFSRPLRCGGVGPARFLKEFLELPPFSRPVPNLLYKLINT